MNLTNDMYARWCTMLCELGLRSEDMSRKERAILVATKEWARKGAQLDKSWPVLKRAQKLIVPDGVSFNDIKVETPALGLAMRILLTSRWKGGNRADDIKARLECEHMAEAIVFAKKLGAKEIMLRAAWNLIFS